jgi:hypothetical protein
LFIPSDKKPATEKGYGYSRPQRGHWSGEPAYGTIKPNSRQTADLRKEEIMSPAKTPPASTPSQLIGNQVAELADWRGKVYARLRKLVLKVAPGLTEEWK